MFFNATADTALAAEPQIEQVRVVPQSRAAGAAFIRVSAPPKVHILNIA